MKYQLSAHYRRYHANLVATAAREAELAVLKKQHEGMEQEIRKAIAKAAKIEARGERVCRTCHVTKKIEDFYKSSRGGYESECKACKVERKRVHTAELTDKFIRSALKKKGIAAIHIDNALVETYRQMIQAKRAMLTFKHLSKGL